MEETKDRVWLEDCRNCKRKHYMKVAPCPSCRVYTVAVPSSSAVYDDCWADYDCDGCVAYRDHQR